LQTRFRHVECDCGFISIHSSHSCRSETGCVLERRVAPATGRVQTQRSAAKSEQPRSIILDRPVHDLAGLAICVDIRAAGNCNILAPQSVQTILVEVVETEPTGASADWRRDSKADPQNGDRQSHMGSTSDTW